MTARLVLALLSGGLCGMAGMRRARLLKRRAEALSAWVRYAEKLDVYLAEGGCTLPEALARACTQDDLPGRRMRDAAQRLRAEPTRTLSEAYEAAAAPFPPYEGETERALLREMVQGLSRGTLESRRLALRQGKALLKDEAENARRKAERDVKLTVTLGWTAGACVMIVLL